MCALFPRIHTADLGAHSSCARAVRLDTSEQSCRRVETRRSHRGSVAGHDRAVVSPCRDTIEQSCRRVETRRSHRGFVAGHDRAVVSPCRDTIEPSWLRGPAGLRRLSMAHRSRTRGPSGLRFEERGPIPISTSVSVMEYAGARSTVVRTGTVPLIGLLAWAALVRLARPCTMGASCVSSSGRASRVLP